LEVSGFPLQDFVRRDAELLANQVCHEKRMRRDGTTSREPLRV
jgi:hypothetical protein